MTKAQRRKDALQRHYSALEALAARCGVKTEGKKLSLKLLRLEKQATKSTTAYCNGDAPFNGDHALEFLDTELEPIVKQVQGLFGHKLQGFHLNRDPRGYALKIDDSTIKTEYSDIPLRRDMGGYGILAPWQDFTN